MTSMTLDFALGDNADMIRETTKRFAADKIAPLAAKIDADDWFPRDELWRAMGELGLHGITVDAEDGGLGMGYLEHVIAVEEVSRASASIGLSYGAHSNLCINQIARWANPEQKAKYLPKLISGEHVGSLAMSETGAGSDVVSMKLKAEAVQGGYILNGTKFWITNAPYADTLVVYAKTAPEAASRGITAFLIEKDMEGFSIGQKIDKVGMRGSPTAELVFNDCFISDEQMMGPLHGGVGVLMSGLDYERVVLAGLQLGVMQACLDVVLPYVRERKQFGIPLGTFQALAMRMADSYIDVEGIRSTYWLAMWRLSEGVDARAEVRIAKWWACDAAHRVVATAQHLHGGMGADVEYPIHRFFLMAKLISFSLGNATQQLEQLGRVGWSCARAWWVAAVVRAPCRSHAPLPAPAPPPPPQPWHPHT